MYTLREWQLTPKPIDNLIVQASTIDGCDRWQPFPIGMQFSYIYNYKKPIQIGNHENTVLCAINQTTDNHRRPHGLNRQLFIKNLNKNNIINNRMQHDKYFDILPSYKFIISPEGNGIDCHRHYEALIAGSIPIMEYNELTEQKYLNCPVLYTKDYSEITEEYLISKYNEMIDTPYNFSCLFLSYYDSSTQSHIKECGNYWMQNCTRQQWY